VLLRLPALLADILAAVRASGLEPLTSLVRRGTLEDVFLRLTGRRLED
jgi:lipooligosaccharide transport system ATP-binding protein